MVSARHAARAAFGLFVREWIRFYRQRGRVIAAVVTPLLFWGAISSGFSRWQSGSYGDFLLPGSLLLGVLFTSIFSTISVIEDRQNGFLQHVLLSPAPRGAFVLSKLAAGSLIATVQAMVSFALIRLSGAGASLSTVSILSGVCLASIGLTALGFALAWYTESTQSYHGYMNSLLMPLWFFSGALFPAETQAPFWRVVIAANPLSYLLRIMREPHLGGDAAGWMVATVWVLSMCALSAFLANRPSKLAAN